MPREVRVGDTVNLKLNNGDTTTAEVTAITSQDIIDLVYYNPQRNTVAAAPRATTWPPAEGSFWDMA